MSDVVAQGQPIYEAMCTDDDEKDGASLWMEVNKEAYEMMAKRSDMRVRIVYAAPLAETSAMSADPWEEHGEDIRHLDQLLHGGDIDAVSGTADDQGLFADPAEGTRTSIVPVGSTEQNIKAAESYLPILDHWAQDGKGSATVTRVVFKNAAFMIRKLIASLQSPAVTASEPVDITGWKLVPDQPTGTMWEAGRGADIHPGDSYTKVWCAMFDAAPSVEDCETVRSPSQPGTDSEAALTYEDGVAEGLRSGVLEVAKIVSIWSDIAAGTKKAIQEEHFMLAECLDKLVKGDGK